MKKKIFDLVVFLKNINIKIIYYAFLVPITSLLFQFSTVGQSVPIMGFSEECSKHQLSVETEFDQLFNAENLDKWMKYMSARPHHVGSDYDKKVTDFIVGKFRDWGYDVKIEQFNVMFPTPKVRILEMIAPTNISASLTEPSVKEDSYSAQTEEALPVYNRFSIDGYYQLRRF